MKLLAGSENIVLEEEEEEEVRRGLANVSASLSTLSASSGSSTYSIPISIRCEREEARAAGRTM